MSTQTTIQEYNVEKDAYQGKFGWHPCDYDTFLKLKFLNRLYWQTLRQAAAWNRWVSKMPHNRVIRKKIRDENGRVIGREFIPVPMPEPEVNEVFAHKRMGYIPGKHHYDRWGRRHDNPIQQEYLVIESFDIVLAYQQARMPKTLDKVKKLPISKERIEFLYNLARK